MALTADEIQMRLLRFHRGGTEFAAGALYGRIRGLLDAANAIREHAFLHPVAEKIEAMAEVHLRSIENAAGGPRGR